MAIVFIRYLLEALLENHHVLAPHLDLRLGLVDFMHVLVSWGVLYALLTLGLAWISGRGQAATNRVVLAAYPLICLPPLLDFALGQSGQIAYQHDFSEFVSSFFGLFNPAVSVSYVTPGVRVEVACAVLLAGGYGGHGQRGVQVVARGLAAAGWIYGVVFLLGFLPALWFAMLGGDQSAWLGRSVLRVSSTASALYWYLPLLAALAPIWLWRSWPGGWHAVVASLRPSRLLIYLAICNLAFYSAADLGLVGWDWLNPYDLAEVGTLNLALALAFVAMTMVNDVYDQEIDRVSNPKRPLLRGLVTEADFRLMGWLCGGLALGLAIVVDETAVYPLAATLALGWLYSAPPFRLRRFVGVAHLLLAAIAMSVYLYGASPILGNLGFQQIDQGQWAALGLLFFIGAHFKDIKDYEGDRRAGVSTLATWLGPIRAYWWIGGGVLILGAALIGLGVLKMGWATGSAFALFTLGWLLLRNAERLFVVMLVAMAVLFMGGWHG